MQSMQPKRAQEIIQAAYNASTYGPWVDQLDKVMTQEERAQVNEVWETMPGSTSFYDAINRIARSDGSNWTIVQRRTPLPSNRTEPPVRSNEDNIAMPEGLDEVGQKAWETIIGVLRADEATHTGGCKVFYSPEAWRARGEKYGLNSKLVVVYDGGSHAAYFSLSYGGYALEEKMQKALEVHGLFFEEGTHWYGAVYPIRRSP